MRKTRFMDEHIVGILKLVEAGQTVVEVCRSHWVSQGTYYSWQAQYGGMQVRRARLISAYRCMME